MAHFVYTLGLTEEQQQQEANSLGEQLKKKALDVFRTDPPISYDFAVSINYGRHHNDECFTEITASLSGEALSAAMPAFDKDEQGRVLTDLGRNISSKLQLLFPSKLLWAHATYETGAPGTAACVSYVIGEPPWLKGVDKAIVS